jgi:hypothetical protein
MVKLLLLSITTAAERFFSDIIIFLARLDADPQQGWNNLSWS